jgi:hypothetical protein
MLSRFDLLLKLRARNLKQMRNILVNNIRKCPRIVEVEFMAMLKTTRKEQTVSLNFFEKESLRKVSESITDLPNGFIYSAFLSLMSATNQDSHHVGFSVRSSAGLFLCLVVLRASLSKQTNRSSCKLSLCWQDQISNRHRIQDRNLPSNNTEQHS